MKRSEEIQSVVGQTAYGLYRAWLEKQKKKPPEITAFLTSMYYTAFTRFAAWIRETGIGEPQKYVELMVNAKISPINWRRPEAYQIYLEHFDHRADPLDQARITYETLLAFADGLECEVSEVFSKLTAGEVLELIQQRRLSPWLLLCARSFKEWVEKLNPSDYRALMSGIGVEFWSTKFEQQPKRVIEMRELAREMGL